MPAFKTTAHAFFRTIMPPQLIRQKLNKKGSKTVLLTFDDGPHSTITPRVLDLLDEYEARALFFVIGSRINDNPWLIKEIINRGHQIGNHTYSHPLRKRLSFDEYYKEILLFQEQLFEIDGSFPIYFRPPQGIVTFQMLFHAKRQGLKIIRWSVDTGEYSDMQGESADKMAMRFLERVKERDIVLSHDDNSNIPRVLEIILPELKNRGFDLYNGLDCLD